jgi:5-(carboxyamino)imidazole ribonucleotide mutase/phosphoribosylaminoimidazole-succinocarboxamide synthase
MTAIVPILMGSKSDQKHAEKIIAALDRFGIQAQIRVASAHKTPARLLQVLEEYEADSRQKVYITIAGRSNALSGMVDAQVQSPVIACPPPSESFGGADIFSSLRMPSGVAPAVVLDPEGAALFAAKIFALTDPIIRANIAALQKENQDKLFSDDAEFNP